MSRKIALFLPNLNGGGAERVMVNLARGFAERGMDVDLVIAKAEGPYLAQVPTSVNIIDLDASRLLKSLPGLIKYLRRCRPVTLLAALEPANILAIWAKKISGVSTRVVISVHTTPSQAITNSRIVQERCMPFLMRCFYPWADGIVAVSKGTAEDVTRITGASSDKVQVIYNPVITPEIYIKAEEPLDHPWFAPGQPPVILSVGRLTPAKDYPTLITAFAMVRKRLEARLVILGEGEERARLETLIQELGLEQDVYLPGFVENPFKYMKRANVFVLSSKWEGFGNVLVEALALGTQIISTDCKNGPAEILEGGRWGRLVPVGDVNILAGAISDLLLSNDKIITVDNSILSQFALDVVLNKYADILCISF